MVLGHSIQFIYREVGLADGIRVLMVLKCCVDFVSSAQARDDRGHDSRNQESAVQPLGFGSKG